jgi:filamentous hemagglutinin family protein
MTSTSAFRCFPAPWALVLLLACGGLTLPIQANPAGPTVTQGNATFSSQGSQLTIQTSDRAFINWQSFNIGVGQTTTFLQPSSSSVVWNQINDPNASQILGTLNANGYVILQNQAGFYVGGQACINAHGLLMTTAPIQAPDLLSGGAWQFNAPPPTASIVNYGQINIAGGGSAFLIAHDIQNNGEIIAPGGDIGLYAGKQVLISDRPDGRGLSAQVTLPEGSVDNSGQLIADAGTITMRAQVVNQGGLVQANSVREVNGVIQLIASDAVNLGPGSVISAQGGSQGSSSGGTVTIKSGGTFSDDASSVIIIAGGAQGGNGGQAEVSAASIDSIKSTIDGRAAPGFVGGGLTIDPTELTVTATLLNSYLGLSAINLQADDAITVSGICALSDSTTPATLTLTAGNNIYVGGIGATPTAAITVGKNWSLDLTVQNAGTTRTMGSITLYGDSYLQTQDGTMTLSGARNVSIGAGGIQALNGGSIDVMAQTGSITVGGVCSLADSAQPATLDMTAGASISLSAASALKAGQNGSLNLTAGTASSAGSISLNGTSFLQAENGDITLFAPNNVTIGAGGMQTLDGGSISVTAQQGGITVGGLCALADSTQPTTLNMTAGNSITLNDGSSMTAGQNGSLSLIAGTGSASGSITLSGSANLKSQNGNITLSAPGDVTLGDTAGSGSVQTLGGGSIAVTSQSGSITVGGACSLADSAQLESIAMTAGGGITMSDSSSITAGENGSLSLTAGTSSASGSVTLKGSAYVETQNGNTYPATQLTQDGNITVFAADNVSVGQGAIRTLAGGSIDVTARLGSVNAGVGTYGYDLTSKKSSSADHAPPYYSVDPNLSGISTAAGGNVTITAGGNVASYLPNQLDYDANSVDVDAGSGAFGPGAGNVTITAGGNISGHYVVANGVGTIRAGGNIGAPVTQSGDFDLSLIKGSWNVYAPNGYIYLREVRNPNGVFNDRGGSDGAWTYASTHSFDYDLQASVLLDAGDFVEITGGAPRPDDNGTPVPVIFPPSLTVITGAGGLVLDTDVILFPSPYGNLNLMTLNGGNFQGNGHSLEMSDSGSKQWNYEDPTGGSRGTFGPLDYGTTPIELNNPNPVQVSVSGDLNNLTLYTTKETEITVGGNMNNSSLMGENLHAGDVTSINVAGTIYNTPTLSFAQLSSPIVSANPLQPGEWDSVFELAVDPTAIATFNTTGLSMTQIEQDLRGGYELFPAPSHPLGYNPGFIYNSTTSQLGFNGNLSTSLTQKQITALEAGTFTVLVVDVNGNPIVGPSGYLETKTYTLFSSSLGGNPIKELYTESLSLPSQTAYGIQIGGPGQLDVTASSIELGNTFGIVSWGIGNPTDAGGNVNYAYLAPLTASGASINVTVSGDISMLTSRIATFYGGDVNVTSTGGSLDLGSQDFLIANSGPAFGIYTAGHSDVSVTAYGDVNIDGSRIGAYDGGGVFIESYHGSVSTGSGGNTYVPVWLVAADSSSGTITTRSDEIYGSGILALSLPTKGSVSMFNAAGVSLPGNIDVETPQGDIIGSQAGILQMALGGSVASGPTINLNAGTFAADGSVLVPGNIDFGSGSSGVIGGTLNANATGNIVGTFISRQNSTINAAQNFIGTLLSSGTATVSAGQAVSGTVIGITGASVSGGTVTAAVLSQNASVNGGSSTSTLGTTAAATTTSQNAAGQGSSDAKQQVAADTTQDDDERRRRKQAARPALTRRVGRVTVILPPA